MTEQEFQTQVWRPYDKITTADGVPGKVLGVSFTTKSVRAFISGAPEWVRCELIETHTTGKGGDADDAALIDSLREKVLRADKRINDLELEREKLIDKMSKNHLADIMTALNMLKEGLTIKKKKMEKVDNAIGMIERTLSKIEVNP
jgi:hypothetical protein